MNFLKLLLTIYFMVLSVVPCNDVNAQSQNNVKLPYGNLQNQEDSHSKDHGDICSPFCCCNCCQMPAASCRFEPLSILPDRITEYFSKKIHFRKNNFAYSVYHHIWQPPKI
ncbi:DUF6660 family protein [Chryseobacterium sp. JJR-5R]|uniref:DUF6660 family protein n=1 Tax=Chryseobacterium sp. JJR-5R TaxID=3093923 RepID=UPI002A762388|nr:DUF6660 family protein [Chryseobacterium sp. JJR-5R]WPO84335.1 DUF6660 family protein [Chryseobacterium sp. JJR-5R]